MLFRRSIECITAIYLWNKIIQLSFNLLFKQYCMELSLKQIRIFLTTYYMGAFEAKSDFPDGCIDTKYLERCFAP